MTALLPWSVPNEARDTYSNWALNAPKSVTRGFLVAGNL
jgi:hypothetical protein